MALIAKDDVIKWTPSQNLEDTQVLPQIEIAQQKYIRKALGDDLYDKIVSDFNADTLTGGYLTLYKDYISPALAFYTLYECMPYMKSEPTAQGLIMNDPDYTEVASEKAYQRLCTKYLSDAELYIDNMEDYICKNNTLFPEYGETKDISNKVLPYLY